jgi:hypothetical protein
VALDQPPAAAPVELSSDMLHSLVGLIHLLLERKVINGDDLLGPEHFADARSVDEMHKILRNGRQPDINGLLGDLRINADEMNPTEFNAMVDDIRQLRHDGKTEAQAIAVAHERVLDRRRAGGKQQAGNPADARRESIRRSVRANGRPSF